MLKVQNISTGYGKKQVLFDVSLEVAKGEIVLLAGSNGSGKSTLLKSIFGLLPLWNTSPPAPLSLIRPSGTFSLDLTPSPSPTGEGSQRRREAERNFLERGVWFDGENITGKPTAALLKSGLLYIPQKNNLYEELTVKENLEMAGLTLDKNLLKQRIENSLSIFTTLPPLLNRTPMKLSGGERTLLTLAMANLHQPKMLLIDEPYTGLSPQNLSLVTENLKMLNEKTGISLLIVEHRVKECLSIAHRVIGLKLGRHFNEFLVNSDFDLGKMNEIFI